MHETSFNDFRDGEDEPISPSSMTARNFMTSLSLWWFLKFFWFSVGWMKAKFLPRYLRGKPKHFCLLKKKKKTKYYYHIMVASKNGRHKGKELGKITWIIHTGVKIDTYSKHNRNRSGGIYSMPK